jgi:hypothetical protein
MYGSLVRIPAAASDKLALEMAVDQITGEFMNKRGFQNAMLVLDDSAAECTFLSVWKSLEQADAAGNSVRTRWPAAKLATQVVYVPQASLPTDAEATLLMSEQKTLRDEIVKRLEMQHQLLGGVLVAAGTLLTVGVAALSPPAASPGSASGMASVAKVLLLLYPVLVLFVAVSWHLHNITINRISSYIRSVIESRFSTHGLGWEHYHSSSTGGSAARFLASLLSTVGILCGTQVMAILIVTLPDWQTYWAELARLLTNFTQEWQMVAGEVWLFLADLVILVATFCIVYLGFRTPPDALV